MQVERKAVADIDRSGSSDSFPQKPAQREAGLGLQMPLPCFAAELPPGQSQGRATQHPGNVDIVPLTRSIAAQGPAARDGAADGYVTGEGGGVGQVAAGKDARGSISGFHRSVEEAVDPFSISPLRNGHCGQTKLRGSTHGCDIGQAAGDCFVAHVASLVGRTQEMDVLYKQIRREQQVISGAAGTPDGAIVANSQHQLRAGRDAHGCAEARSDIRFAHGHGVLFGSRL